MKYDYKKSDGGKFSLGAFISPDSEFYTAFCWSWNAEINREEVVRQLDEYYNNGIKRLYILPMPSAFRPWTKNLLDPDYLTPEYFEIYKFTFEYAAKLGMKLWLYDEGGWPSGSACGKVLSKKPEYGYKTILTREVSSPYKAGEDAVAGFCNGVRVEEGFASDSPIIEYYFKIMSNLEPNACEKGATELFINLTHEKYKEYLGDMFGKSLKVAFTDEPVCDFAGWCEGFENLFLERYGYDVRDVIPVICKKEDESFTEDEEKIRREYFDLLAEQFCKNYFLTLREWCRDNNLISSGHLNTDDVTWDYRQRFHHRMRHLRAFDMPGIDMIWRQIFPGKKNHFYPRFASSASNQIGSLYTLSESYSIFGAGLTYDEMRYLLLYQMSRGINVINVMHNSYSYKGKNRRNGRPGFEPFFPTWRHLNHFSLYSARLSYLMSLGVVATEHAVYFPQEEIWCGGDKLKRAVASFDGTVYNLERFHIPADIIDGDFLETSYLEDGAIRTGNARYKTVVIPDGITVFEKHRGILDNFVKNGGRVVYNADVSSQDAIAEISCEKVSVYKRLLGDDALYLMQNEDSESVTFSTRFLESGNVYELDALTGDIYEAELENVTWCSGEGHVYLVTDKSYSAKKRRKFEKSITLADFEIKRKSQFKIGADFERVDLDDEFVKTSAGDFCDLYGKEFSGEVIYRVEFDLDEIPQNLEIDLGTVKYSCDVELNGHKIADMCFSPFRCVASGECIKAKNVMLITVANTPANEFVSSRVFEKMTKEELGPYHEVAKEFEKESLESGLMNEIYIRY